MGAQEFAATAFGRTPAEAFRRAVQEARDYYGSGGYTGTIAEKHEFVIIHPPPRIQARRAAEFIFAATYALAEWFSPRDRERTEREFRETVPEKFRAWAIKNAGHVDDKWGPAVCIPVVGQAAKDYRNRHGHVGQHGNVYLFIGKAPS